MILEWPQITYLAVNFTSLALGVIGCVVEKKPGTMLLYIVGAIFNFWLLYEGGFFRLAS